MPAGGGPDWQCSCKFFSSKKALTTGGSRAQYTPAGVPVDPAVAARRCGAGARACVLSGPELNRKKNVFISVRITDSSRPGTDARKEHLS